MKKLVSILIVALMISSIALFSLPAPASADGNILEVGDGKAYATIQAAVDAAVPGDTILVYPGYYPESVSIAKNNLTLLAQDEVVLVEPPEVAGFLVDADRVTIRGFEIYWGWKCAVAFDFEGSFNTFVENSISFAPGAPCVGGEPVVCLDDDGGSDYNTIENNEIYGSDGGLSIISNAPDALNKGNVVRDNLIYGSIWALFVNNGTGFDISGNELYADSGTCLSIWADNSVHQGYHRIINNTPTGCGFLGAGSGIELYALNSTKLTHNIISENQVSESFFSPGIYLYTDDSGAKVSRNLIRDNTVYQNSNGVVLGSGADNNLVLNNLVETQHAEDQDGMGIVISSNFNTVAKNNVLDNATDGIHVEGNFNTIFGNTSLDNDGWDLADYGLYNKWFFNEYGTASWE